jgi:hypothetical protein
MQMVSDVSSVQAWKLKKAIAEHRLLEFLTVSEPMRSLFNIGNTVTASDL